ncbi:hypothetical protein G8E10_17595 [Rhizobiaceae bacterium CRRU44]|uniref:Antirepressor protein C-terminal domain-containing protein n=1 Tax=Ferranicluibacter rubi TaxID=2715133 RepID=A0AA43ZI68_9HYPH|nr:phage antirepressor KilAC domain-containing protein [Ferranicluibacter rubi]NHT77531.1 hypothetical protein [Ferranicluibacter rubi]
MTENHDGEAAPNTALTLEDIGGELRIEDTILGKRLGFSEPKKIRPLIKRHAAALEKFGARLTVSRVVNGGAAEVSYLNRQQAIFITAKSGTEVATQATIEIVKRFDELEQNSRQNAPQFAVPRTLADALRLALEQTEKVERQAAQIDAMKTDIQVLERIQKADDLYGIRQAAQILQVEEKKFTAWLVANRWCFRHPGSAVLMAFADKRRAPRQFAVHKLETFEKRDGSQGSRETLKFTTAGISRLAAEFNVADMFGGVQ